MNWIKALPTKPGYYFWRKNKYKGFGVYTVFGQDILYCRWCCRAGTLCDKEIPFQVGGEWYGPLEEPE